jgi:uncharacterized metal-binding protein YceD (DUF177 family)
MLCAQSCTFVYFTSQRPIIMTENDLPPLPSQLHSVATIAGKKPLHFTYAPDAATRAVIAAHLALIDLPKLMLKGSFAPQGRGDVVLRAQFSAQVVQPCAVTLAPVTTHLSGDITRDYLRDFSQPDAVETEIGPEDQEPLPEQFDIAAIAIEELILALPQYPRAKDASLAPLVAAPAGAVPLTDAALRPFAGLASLAQAMAEPKDPDSKDSAPNLPAKDEKP